MEQQSQLCLRTLRCNWPNKELQTSDKKLKTYSGEPLLVKGTINVQVKYGVQGATLPLLVVAGNGPTLFGREWLGKIKLDWRNIHSIQNDALQLLLQKYAPLFSEGLGKLNEFKATIQVDPQVSPKFCKPLPIPYAHKSLVEEILDQLSSLGIIAPVQFADWAAPIVPVLKRDKKSVCICGDYSVTVNQASKLECYPILKLDDLLASLAGVVFSKLDMSEAYQQIELDDESKKYIIINTVHKGLFKYNMLLFGVSSAPAIFQSYGECFARNSQCLSIH